MDTFLMILSVVVFTVYGKHKDIYQLEQLILNCPDFTPFLSSSSFSGDTELLAFTDLSEILRLLCHLDPDKYTTSLSDK